MPHTRWKQYVFPKPFKGAYFIFTKRLNKPFASPVMRNFIYYDDNIRRDLSQPLDRVRVRVSVVTDVLYVNSHFKTCSINKLNTSLYQNNYGIVTKSHLVRCKINVTIVSYQHSRGLSWSLNHTPWSP